MRAPIAIVSFCLCLVGLSASPARGDGLSAYSALRNASLSGPTVAVSNLVLERDAFRFRFDSGTFQLLAPVDGRVTGAVFSGEGSVELSPVSETEQRFLTLRTGERGNGPLTDRFQSAVLLFTDSTRAEIERSGKAGPPADPALADRIWSEFLRRQKKVLKRNLQLRLLRDLLADASAPGSPPAARGMFLAAFAGRRLPASLAVFDPTGLDWLAPASQIKAATTCLYALDPPNNGFWYLAGPATAATARAAAPVGRAFHYALETSIARNADLRGTTTIDFRSSAPGLMVLPVALAPRLRLSAASLSCGQAAPTPAFPIQENAEEDADAAVVFVAPPPAGEPCALRLTYEGRDVLQSAGDGVYVVRARESWYPNLGVFAEPATFDLTYRVPKANQVISVGKKVGEQVEGDARVSEWKAERPIRVAGFNYGNFQKTDLADATSGLKIEVYTNPGTPDVVTEINRYLSQSTSGMAGDGPGSPIPADLSSPFATISGPVGLREIRVDTETLAKSALADGINSARVCTAYFGKLSEDHVSITEQTQWTFGQSWPSLVFLPYLAFLDGTTRQELGLRNTASFVEQVGLHEFAHQWWGHLVGWSGYQDVWLSEGFSEFSAGLILEHAAGARKANAFWENARRWIVLKPALATVANDGVGPMTLGFRLDTPRNPTAYDAMVYAKGAFVLHMLRMMMRDSSSRTPDEPFQALMKDFVATHSGKNASTRDFQDAVERHMVPNLNATHDGKADWFFQQWVYGTEIPRLKSALTIKKMDGDNYRIKGTVAQEGVSDSFRVLVPIWIEIDKALYPYATIPLMGTKPFPVEGVIHSTRKLTRAVINARHEVLTRD